MKLRFNGNLEIEDTRNHPAEVVESLRKLLTNGAYAQIDAHRQNFFEVENGKLVYYIHVSPATGRVHLLATWDKDAAAAQA